MLKEKLVEFLGCEKFWLGANVLFLKDRPEKKKGSTKSSILTSIPPFENYFLFRNYNLLLW
jgi:hypothetical protein